MRTEITEEAVQRVQLLTDDNSHLFFGRVEDHLSYVDSGGLRWDRRIQVRIPELNGRADAQALHIVPLGTFRRRRIGDFSVKDAGGSAVPLLTRDEHGSALTAALLQKFPIFAEEVGDPQDRAGQLSADPTRNGWVPTNCEQAREALAYLVHSFFTAGRATFGGDPKDGDTLDHLAFCAAMQSCNYYVLSGRFDDEAEAEKAIEDVVELLTDLRSLKDVTSYLCWVQAVPGAVVTLDISYTTDDPTESPRKSEGPVEVLLDEQAGASRQSSKGRWKSLGLARSNAYARTGLMGTVYEIRLPASARTASYYFTVSPPRDSAVEYMWWESDHSLSDSPSEFMCSRPGFNLHNGLAPPSPFQIEVLDSSSDREDVALNGAGAGGVSPAVEPSVHEAVKDDSVDGADSEIVAPEESLLVQFYVRPQFADHKQLAAGGVVGLLLAMLFAVGALDASLSPRSSSFSWFSGWLVVTPVAFFAFAARNRRSYYGGATTVLRCSIWVYLSVCALFLVAISVEIGAQAPSPLPFLLHDEVVFAVLGAVSVFVAIWYASLGRGIRNWVADYVRRVLVERDDSASDPDQRLDPREFYAVVFHRSIDMLLLFAVGAALLAGAMCAALALNGVSLFGLEVSRWGVLGLWILLSAMYGLAVSRLSLVLIRSAERSMGGSPA